jgi:hypothetical protein
MNAGLDMAEDQFLSSDNVTPIEIEHRCDEIFKGEGLLQKYNYIVHHFDYNGSWARTYTDEINTVAEGGPFASRDRRNLNRLRRPPGPKSGMTIKVARACRKGVHIGRVAVHESGSFDIGKAQHVNWKYCQFKRADGSGFAVSASAVPAFCRPASRCRLPATVASGGF